jgi:RNA polymerase sigma-70 factor (ECF subfamily)
MTVGNRHDFETRILPHLDAAYNLARWLLRNDQNAEDAVQEAAIRALRYFDRLRDGDARPWFLGIVRNTCFTALERSRSGPDLVEFDEEGFQNMIDAVESDGDNPEFVLQQRRTRQCIDAAIRALSPPLREVLVLREFEDLEYAEIARIASVPIGTVMSRLARAREKMRAALSSSMPRN